MWGTLLKALLTSLEPQLKPLLNVLVQKVVELLLKNIGGNQAGGILSLSAGITQTQLDDAIEKTVNELMDS